MKAFENAREDARKNRLVYIVSLCNGTGPSARRTSSSRTRAHALDAITHKYKGPVGRVFVACVKLRPKILTCIVKAGMQDALARHLPDRTWPRVIGNYAVGACRPLDRILCFHALCATPEVQLVVCGAQCASRSSSLVHEISTLLCQKGDFLLQKPLRRQCHVAMVRIRGWRLHSDPACGKLAVVAP